jgi:hypothetical protein
MMFYLHQFDLDSGYNFFFPLFLGLRFGLMQIKTGLIQILSRYEVSPCKNTPVSLTFDPKTFLLSAIGDMTLSFNRRRSEDTSG